MIKPVKIKHPYFMSYEGIDSEEGCPYLGRTLITEICKSSLPYSYLLINKIDYENRNKVDYKSLLINKKDQFNEHYIKGYYYSKGSIDNE